MITKIKFQGFPPSANISIILCDACPGPDYACFLSFFFFSEEVIAISSAFTVRWTRSQPIMMGFDGRVRLMPH